MYLIDNNETSWEVNSFLNIILKYSCWLSKAILVQGHKQYYLTQS